MSKTGKKLVAFYPTNACSYKKQITSICYSGDEVFNFDLIIKSACTI